LLLETPSKKNEEVVTRERMSDLINETSSLNLESKLTINKTLLIPEETKEKFVKKFRTIEKDSDISDKDSLSNLVKIMNRR